VKSIPVHGGNFAVVDDEDYERLVQHGWYLNSKGYAKTTKKAGMDFDSTEVFMHRLILGVPKDVYVDHINMNKLDNRKANLRKCTQSENKRNCKLRTDNTSGKKGVHHTRLGWRARIQLNGRRIHLGYFPTAEEAAQAYDRAAETLHGEFARTNASLS
jgi:hypothetical protein